MPAEVTRIISDVHFGDRATRVTRLEQLRPLLAGVDHLVLNGDTLDTRPGPLPAHTAACRDALAAFFGTGPARVTFLTGNHDADFSPHHYLDLANGQVFATHGDIVFEDIVPWSRDAGLIRQRIRTELAGLAVSDRENLHRRLELWRRVAHSIPQRHQSESHGVKYAVSYVADTLWPPWRVLKIFRAWQTEPPLIAALVARHRPKAKFVLTGHLHRPSIWQAPTGTVVINTGSFCPPLDAYAVDLMPGQLAVKRVAMRGADFHIGGTIAEFPLAES